MTQPSPPECAETPAGAVARGTIVAPPSKSHAIRVLVCAALAVRAGARGGGARDVEIRFGGTSLPDDARAAATALGALGWDVRTRDGTVVIGGDADPANVPAPGAVADVGGSGTALRFVAAVAALSTGPVIVTGNAQLLRRPAGAILAALRELGVEPTGTVGDDGVVRPPIEVRGGPPRGVRVTVDASESSQTVSALLLLGSALAAGIEVVCPGDVASRPYIELTIETLRSFGADVEYTADVWRSRGPVRIPDGPVVVEGDWSSAAFLLGAAAATGGDVRVLGLRANSAQADRRIVDVLAAFGADCGVEPANGTVRATGRVSRPVDLDLRDAPDLAPLVGALACLVGGTSRVRGAAHLRIKETDRIAEVVRCARALGCEAREGPDGFEIRGPAMHAATIDPAGDHRLAMAFAVAGLAVPGTRTLDPACVAKSYPEFWEALARLCA